MVFSIVAGALGIVSGGLFMIALAYKKNKKNNKTQENPNPKKTDKKSTKKKYI